MYGCNGQVSTNIWPCSVVLPYGTTSTSCGGSRLACKEEELLQYVTLAERMQESTD